MKTNPIHAKSTSTFSVRRSTLQVPPPRPATLHLQSSILAGLVLLLCLAVGLGGGGGAYAGTYDEWVQAHHLPSATSGPADAPAGDGIANLLKFALGLEPLTPGPRPLFEPIIVDRAGQQLFGLRLTLDTRAQGVRLNLDRSEDLRTWTPCPVLLEPLADLGSGVLRVQLLANQPLSASRSLFLRLGAAFTTSGQIVSGPTVPVLTNSVGPTGGTLTVDAPATPLTGLVVDVPVGAYPGPRTFTISCTPIITHNFPASITPATPLIHIDNGGALANQIMTVTVPVSLAPDEFALGFIYHPQSGELEGLPLVALSTNSITIATRHFSDFFISRIPYHLLPDRVDSGFRPGVDDWEFENQGSFLAVGGQCSGQSQSAMWYYCTKRLNDPSAPPLYNLYDNSLYSFRTTNFGPDNVLGIKLASRVQEDTDWDSLGRWFWMNSRVEDRVTLSAFTYSIWVTGEPQRVAITSTNGGHAMVAYRVENGSIYVADPNYPGVTNRQILYSVADGGFQPYFSGATAADLGQPFPDIFYTAKTTINDWTKIGQRWGELEAGTIADADFPVFKIVVKELQAGAWVDIGSVTNGQPTEAAIQTGADQVQTRGAYVSGPVPVSGGTTAFDTNGTWLENPTNNWIINLAMGTNRLGVLVEDERGEESWWASFSWLTVVRTNVPYTFTTLAGLAGNLGSTDGTNSAARFRWPSGVAVDSATNVYVADFSNHTIRKVTPAGVVTTLAGLAGQAGSNDGTGSAARFWEPYGVAVDSSGNVYVADSYNDTIRKVTPAGRVTTLAGLAGESGSADGTGSAARFALPAGVAVDRAGNVYVAESYNNTIRKVTPAGQVTTLAGLACEQGSADGTGSAARFYSPGGVAVDSSGNVYVADCENHTIRKVTPAGRVTTLAGLAETPGSADGTNSAARFWVPFGVAVDSAGNLYVTDCYNHTIRQVTPAGVVTTLAGLAETPGSADGTGSAARFDFPFGVAVDSAGNLYVADFFNQTIRKGTK